MNTSDNFRILYIALFMFLFSACGSGGEEAKETAEEKVVEKKIEQVEKKIESGNSKCDKIIREYDDLVERSLKIVKQQINGEEVDRAEETKIKEDGERLAKRIQKLGVTGLGGVQCWEEYVAIQMKWTNAAMELQQEAIEKAQEQL